MKESGTEMTIFGDKSISASFIQTIVAGKLYDQLTGAYEALFDDAHAMLEVDAFVKAEKFAMQLVNSEAEKLLVGFVA